jgi:hypothetical protein
MTALTVRSKIMRLQELLLSLPTEDLGCELTHFFAPGMYGRRLKMPKGCTIIGKIHKHSHPNYISKGSCLVATEDGVEHIVAPYLFESTPGTKRVVFTLEETTWTTYHKNPSDTTDLNLIESEVIATDYAALAAYRQEVLT